MGQSLMPFEYKQARKRAKLAPAKAVKVEEVLIKNLKFLS